MAEPMSDERLALIRRRLDMPYWPSSLLSPCGKDVQALLAEVDRLRAELAAKDAEIERLRKLAAVKP